MGVLAEACGQTLVWSALRVPPEQSRAEQELEQAAFLSRLPHYLCFLGEQKILEISTISGALLAIAVGTMLGPI